MKNKCLKTLVLLALGIAGPSQADLIEFSIDGTVTNASIGNIFGLVVGDTVSATAVFDDSLFTGVGEEFISFGDGTGNSMTHVIGSLTFIESMDTDFAGGFFPVLGFMDGVFLGWSFIVDEGVNGGPASYAAGFTSATAFQGSHTMSESFLLGEWDSATGAFSNAVTVPEPPTLLLMGLALLAIAFQRRRRA